VEVDETLCVVGSYRSDVTRAAVAKYDIGLPVPRVFSRAHPLTVSTWPVTCPTMGTHFQIAPEVASALAGGRPVVALESTIISHGLPRPDNERIAVEIEDAVRADGAVPATIALLDGVVHVGLTAAQLNRLANSDDVVKASTRDLGTVIARGLAGATTVAATTFLAHRAGIRVFATGGLGGVHRIRYDESADLVALATTPIVVVCAGVKSILDVAATLERLETLGIPVLGVGTDRFPGFFLRDSGLDVPWRVDSAAEVAAILRARDDLGLRAAIIAAQPLPSGEAIDPKLHDRVLSEGLALATENGVVGKDVTPFLLSYFHSATDGATLRANVCLVLRNATFAAQVARELAELAA
jgi:pseudouridine-5'-phosphate glycosidase